MGERSKDPEWPAAASRPCYPGPVPGNPGPPQALGAEATDWGRIRRVGVYGGSFDPVHRGHLHAASCARAARNLERVVFVPAGQAPHKLHRRLASGEDRMAMLALALRSHPDWIADRMELDRPGPSYTVDTLRGIHAHLGLSPAAQLYLVIGSDNLQGLPSWKGIGEILELAQPLVVARETDLSSVFARLRDQLAPALVAKLEQGLVQETPVEASSSEIRERVERGEFEPRDLPPGVWEYIVARGIYGARPRA